MGSPRTTDAAAERPGLVIPPVALALRVVAALEDAAVPVALGGSGLLAALGLVDRVRDWDLTTDAELDAVEEALTAAELAFTPRQAGEEDFATRARLCVAAHGHEVDLIVGFALRADGSVVRLPTRITGRWRGLPLGDPVVWETAYSLMGRGERAEVLGEWLRRQAPVGHGPADRRQEPAGKGR